MGIDGSLTAEIIRRIRTVAAPAKIILFGSAATGVMTSDSDIDLLVVESELVDATQESARLRGELRGLGYPFDVFVISSVWFEESKEVVGGIAYPAHKYGRVIYEAA
ncbi:MAG: nucleotidyltransferase domain-containing protein [Candidatus Hydrogenedentes bacterium]|nr:nucleotidyltransferase domain-containing protein [Candidatus Hydrogenedentota bacterium]